MSATPRMHCDKFSENAHLALCPARYAGSHIFGPPPLARREATCRIPLPDEGVGACLA